MNVSKIVLVRHGESQWNYENRFTGWADIDLSQKGHEEAKYAATLLKNEGFVFDHCYTSMLKRAIHTLWLILDKLDQVWLPVTKNWRLNERHYGALQGLNKVEIAAQYGSEQVKQWRRSFSILPPQLDHEDKRFPGHDPRYNSLTLSQLPVGESLSLTLKRVIPIWQDSILPYMKTGKRILIVAHGNSLRALIKYIDHISNEAIMDVNIPTAMPLVYEFNKDFQSIKHYYLSNSA